MCSIFASFNPDKFEELYKLNSYRGTHSYSISQFDGSNVDIIAKEFGEMKDHAVLEGRYIIGHSQAPTTDEKNMDSVHPSEYSGCYLWHNGIIKHHQVREWQRDYQQDWKWDTKWLNFLLSENDFSVLSEADGSFACLWFDQSYLYLFRNENCPMFSDGVNISSTRFEGSEPIDSNTVYRFENNNWVATPMRFNTKQDFFWSPE